LFLAAFFVLRQRSSFLAIERDRAAAADVAAANGLSLADAFALRDLVGADAPAATWRAAAAEFARLRPQLGEPLAAVAIAGAPDAAAAALAAAGDAAGAWQRFCVDPRAVPGLRFLTVRERFAARIAAHD
jgi:hypothetical protein